MLTDTKLMIFLKAPRRGTVKTRLAREIGDTQACQAYRRLVNHLTRNLESLERVELCYAPADAEKEVELWARETWRLVPQTEGDLGQRMQSAFQRSFDEGFKRVVLIGSDCPFVESTDIEAAWEALTDHDAVFGPAKDGGYWLIGLRCAAPVLFDGIKWSSDSVLAATLERVRQADLSHVLLRELSDIDTESEWVLYVKDHA